MDVNRTIFVSIFFLLYTFQLEINKIDFMIYDVRNKLDIKKKKKIFLF